MLYALRSRGSKDIRQDLPPTARSTRKRKRERKYEENVCPNVDKADTGTYDEHTGSNYILVSFPS